MTTGWTIIVASGEERAGAVRSDPRHGKQLRVMPLDQLREALLQFSGLRSELLDALSQGAQGEPRGPQYRIATRIVVWR